MSNEPISWHTFEDKQREVIRCDSSADPNAAFYAALVIQQIPIKGERGSNFSDTSFTVHIYQPLTLHNFLPVPLRVLNPVRYDHKLWPYGR